ncbi:MAG TPA: caspase family protein [Chloroflexi bacterium]|nr:caspase family protein [Chloroflexota bacterium]
MSTWNTAAIRQLLREGFSDQELKTLAFDHFHPLYNELSSGMGKGEIIQRLIAYCDRTEQMETLLTWAAKENPRKYARFGPYRREVPSPPPQRGPKGTGDPDHSVPGKHYGTGHRWAVLIGVNEYQDWANYGRLKVCVLDVEAIRAQLIAGGFEPERIRMLTDHTPDALPTRANVLVALKAVADATEPDDLLLFYYSGHGDEDGGQSYLVARDGRRLVLADTAIPISRVKEIIQEAPARAKVIVLDACHSGADIGGKGPRAMSPAFIRRVFEQARGIAILSSCEQNQLSYEWQENERSVFTHYLIEALSGQADRDGKGFVTVQDASRHVVNGVKLWASQRDLVQTPTLEYRVAGDIILTRCTP